MADFLSHLQQAKHNRACAEQLLTVADTRDWAIVAAFYSALHYVEAGFTSTKIGHGDKACPKGQSPHRFRADQVNQLFNLACYKSYRKLENASRNVRYLQLSDAKPGTALDYYSIDDAKHFIQSDLADVVQQVTAATKLNLA